MLRAIEKAFRMLPYKVVKLEEWAIRLTMLLEELTTCIRYNKVNV
jgi:hypothetical protein